MQTGSLTFDNLPQILRGLSQKRKSGTLEVVSGTKSTSIVFFQGKIIEAETGGSSPAEELVLMLEQSGFLAPDEILLERPATSYNGLFERLCTSGASGHLFDEGLFRQLIRHRVTQRLYEISLDQGTYYKFHNEVRSVERELLPSISVGQLLLDLVELPQERAAFRERFEKHPYVHRTNFSTKESLSDDGFLLLQTLRANVTVFQLREWGIVHEFALRDALDELTDKGLVYFSSGEQESPESEMESESEEESFVADGSSIDQLMRFLEESIDENFELDELSPAISAQQNSPRSSHSEHDVSRYEASDGSLRPPSREELGEEETERSDIARRSTSYFQSRLLHQSWIPQLLSVLILAASVLLPLLFWGRPLQQFLER